MKTKRTFTLLAAATLYLCGTVSAYIDPGTGSIIFQFLIAGLVGLVYVLKTRINSIRSLADRVFKRNT